MSKKAYSVILVVAVVSVFGVYAVKTALRPVRQEPVQSPTTMDAQAPDSAAENMMTSVRAQIEHLQELEKKDPENVEVLVALGNIYYDAGMAQKAIEYYDRVLEKRHDDVNVLVDKATMLRELKRPREAVELLQRVVKLEPKHEQAWFNLGVMYSADLGDTASAVAAWKTFLEASPTSPHADAVRQEVERLEKARTGH